MEIPAYKKRLVTLAAFAAYEAALKSARSANEKASLSTTQVDEYAVIVEHLKSDLTGGASDPSLGLDGTPLGEQLTADAMKDDDGTDLRVDALDQWMQLVAGCYAPAPVIAGWPLPQRKLVAAWLRAIEKNEADFVAAIKDGDAVQLDKAAIGERMQAQARVTAPDFILADWFGEPRDGDELPMTDAEIAEWIGKGPWDTKPYAAEGVTPGTEWVLVRADTGGNGEAAEESKVAYTDLAVARRAAAEANHALYVEHQTSALAGGFPGDQPGDAEAALHPE